MDTLIRGGSVYDGSGAPPRQADVLLRKGTVAAIQPGLPVENATVVDAEGCAVTPGFVDMHRHCDIAPLRDASFGAIELAQGITSTIVGNCGLSPVPTTETFRRAAHDFLTPVVGPVPPHYAFSHYRQWTQALLEAGLPMNIGFLAGAGAIKTAVNGFARGALSTAQQKEAAALVREAMEAGAKGLSTGLMYQPECWSSRTELEALARVAAGFGGILCTHIRGEGDTLVASVREVIEIAATAEIPLNISHFKATGIQNWHKLIFSAIELIEQARAKGQPVTVDFYPYTGGATTLLSLFPPTVLEDDLSVLVAKMGTPDGKRHLCRELQKDHPGWDNMAKSIGWDRILISGTSRPENATLQGKSLQQAAQETGYADPAQLVAEIVHSEGVNTGIIVMSMAQEDVDTVACLPYAALISDALYAEGTNPHPRLYGAFPRFIREYVLERGLMPLEAAIHKMTGMPAARMKLRGRGILAAGNPADVLVFAPEEFTDWATFLQARQMAEDMRYVFVNGEPVWHHGEMQQKKQGALL